MARAALIPDSVSQVIALYEGPLADIRFPETDRESLVQLVDIVRGLSVEMDEAEKRLQGLQKTLIAQLEALGRKAEQGLQYGKVYAEGDVPNAALLQKQMARVTSPRDAIRHVLDGLSFVAGAKETREVREPREAKPRRRKNDGLTADGGESLEVQAHEEFAAEAVPENVSADEAFADVMH